MTDVTIDAAAMRPPANEGRLEERLLDEWVPRPERAQHVDGSYAATPATITHLFPVNDLVSLSGRVDSVARVASSVVRARRTDLWGVVLCLAVLATALMTVAATGASGLPCWIAVLGGLGVAVRTSPQLEATADVRLSPALRSLAVVFAAAAAASVVGLSTPAQLTDSGWVLVAVGLVLLSALSVRRFTVRTPRVIVVGDQVAVSRAAMRWADGSVNVVGGVLAGAEETRLHSIMGVPTVVGLSQVADWAKGRRADLVVVVPGTNMSAQQVRAVGWSLERAHIRLAVADLTADASPHRVQARRLGGATVVELAPSRRGALTRAVKAVMDRVLGSLLLLVASPFLALMSVLIRFDSRGPAMFRQVRIGVDGRPFTMYKLRTMRVQAEAEVEALREQNEGAGPLFKMQQDPRVTRVGRLLRRTSLDELPQLINVVKGQMSLVGPRPALPAEVAEYDDLEYRRLAVKPGMTGLWQVSGRSDLGWETSVALDLEYVDNWRVSDDLLIGLRTVAAVVNARGAY